LKISLVNELVLVRILRRAVYLRAWKICRMAALSLSLGELGITYCDPAGVVIQYHTTPILWANIVGPRWGRVM
jgi:hypothetical protein